LDIDSGATDIRLGIPINYKISRKRNEPQYIIVANGIKTQIYGIGTTNLFTKNINDVLYLSDFNSSLLSISKITKNLNCNVIFSPNNMVIQDPVIGKIIGEGKLKNGLYYVENEINLCLASSSPVNHIKLLH
jgi:hypothetical protein